MNENCGIFAAYDLEEERTVIPHVTEGLFRLQHRGQLSAGISSFSDTRSQILKTFKGNGLVRDVFKASEESEARRIQNDLKGPIAIGHVRYATSGHGGAEASQPFEFKHPKPNQWFSFAFNGNIANYENLTADLATEGYHLRLDVDTEVLMHLLARSFESKSYTESFVDLQAKVDGACSMVLINATGDCLIYRDQHGFKPICYTVTQNGLCLVSSESAALLPYNSEIIDISPGELMTISRETRQLVKEQIANPKKASCFFEHAYFSYPTSRIDGRSVYESRLKFGHTLAQLEDQEIDENCVVVPVPDSARIAAEGYAEELGIRVRNGIIRNNYVGRTFIEGQDRRAKISRKFSFSGEVLNENRIFVVEDSLVRSTTLMSVIEEMRTQCNPAEIHIRMACPPLFSPCFYGIDIPSQQELFARRFADGCTDSTLPENTLKEMAQSLGANSIKFLPIDTVASSIGTNKSELCMACVTSHYPTTAGQQRYELDIDEE